MTFLQIIRNDPTQIPSLLDQTFNEVLQTVASSASPVPENTESYFNQCKQFLFGQMNAEMAAKDLKSKSGSGQAVCAKTLSYGNVAWKCETCEQDPTCIICQECFEKGDHKGHKVWLKRNVSGCCDCGDPDAWAQDGFCSDHKGYTQSSEALLEQLPAYLKKSSPLVFENVCKQLKRICMEMQKMNLELKKMGQIEKLYYQKVIQGYETLVTQIFDLLEWSIDTSPAFIHYITEAINVLRINELKASEQHKCCPRAFISSQHKEIFLTDFQSNVKEYIDQISSFEQTFDESHLTDINSEQSQKLIEDLKICTCSPLDLTLQTNHFFNEESRKQIYEFYFKLFQSFKFKQHLGLSFVANLLTINNDRASSNAIGSIGVQVLTTDEISLMIIKEQILREQLIQCMSISIESMITKDFAPDSLNALFHLLYDLKYLTRENTLNYMINQTDFLECLLDQLQKLYYKDLIDFKTEHVLFDQAVYKQHLYEIDIQLTKIFKAYIKAIDPFDVQRNKRLMTAFIAFFTEINQKMPTDNKKGFMAMPLHRLFAYYLNRLVMMNYFAMKKTNLKNISPKEIFVKVLKVHLEIPKGKNAITYQQEIIETILRPIMKAWVFIHEIESGKWVMSGFYINHLPTLLYKIFEYYLLMFVSLFQLLICVSPRQDQTIEEMLKIYQSDAWMKQFHSDLISRRTEQNLSVYEGFKPIFDERKLRIMVHSELIFFIQLFQCEISITYPLLSFLNDKSQENYQPFKSQISSMLKNSIRRELVHNLIINGGRSDIKGIKKQSENIFKECDEFEEVLLEVCEQNKDSQGKINFKLKEKYLEWYDPYYCIVPEDHLKIQEVVQNMQNEKKYFNEILGDYQQKYQFTTDVNQIIKEAISSSSLINYVTEILILWQKQEKLKFVDEQIGSECLKLLHVIISTVQQHGTEHKYQQYIQDTIKQNHSELMESISALTKKGEHYQKAIPVIESEIKKLLKMEEQQDQNTKMEGVLSQQSAQDDQAKKQQLKDAAKRKREELLNKFQNKRLDYMAKNLTEQHSLSKASSFKDSTQHDDEEIECSLCKEVLNDDQFYLNPFGQFAYISNSKLMHHTLQQTLEFNRQNLNQLKMASTSITPGTQEEDKSAFEEEEVKESFKKNINVSETLDINYLESKNGIGGTLIKCSHYSHYKCLTDYVTSNQGDKRKAEIQKLIGLDLQTFQCPLCKHISNVLFPSHNLSDYDKIDQSEVHPFEIIEFFTRMFSKIIQSQTATNKDILPIDIRKEPAQLLRNVQKFIEHRIQQIDLKGINEFLKRHKHTVTKNEYADLLEQCRNLTTILVEGSYKIGSLDEEMTEETAKDLYTAQIQKLLATLSDNFFKRDLSSIAIQLIFYSDMLYGNDKQKKQKAANDIIAHIYEPFKLQVLIKQFFIRHFGQIKGEIGQLREAFSIKELIKLQQDESLQDQLIQAQLTFLRKMTATVILSRSVDRRDGLSKDYENDQEFAHKLSQIYDDNEEFEALVHYLNLNPKFDSLLSEYETNLDRDISYIQEDLYSLLKTFSLNDNLESTFMKGFFNTLLQDQGLFDVSETTKVTLNIPDQLLLLTPYFKFNLVELPQDFQSLIKHYYKQNCKNCKTQPKDSCVCLLCGDNLCFLLKCCSRLHGMRNQEGELTYHSRICEGESSLFISTSNGKIIMIEKDRSCKKNSPYMNKFGETYNERSKKWDNFYLDSSTGGQHIYEEYKKMYMNFSIANEIIKERGMSDMVFRMRAI